jgi:cell division septum initiation protein DivIVA
LKVKFLAILVLVSLFFVGCVSTKNVPVADSDIDDFRNRTVTVPKRGVPDFAAFTADKAAFGLIGAAMMISEGNKIIRENQVEDPANYISEQLVSTLSDRYQLVHIETSTSELESEDVKNISRVLKDADYVLDVRTINWQFAYFPSDWDNYRVIYSSKLRLIDTKKSIAIAEGFCSSVPEQDEHAPSYDELLSNNAERLRGELKISADYCIDYFKKNILGLQTHLQASAKIDNPKLEKGNFGSVSKSAVQIGQPTSLESVLETEKKRLADEAARVERLRQELEQLKAQIAQGEKIEQPKLAYIPKTIQTTRVSLRKAPGQLNERHIKNMLLKYHFFDVERNPAGNFTNDYIVNPDGTITDRVTGLIWQKSGSMKRLLWVEAANYVQKMNNQRFAGYSDWRLPTVEELASLMMRNKKQGLYLSSVFDSRQKKCWSADSFSSDTLSYAARYQSAWIVEFVGGYIEWARWSHSAGSGSGHTGDSAHTKNLNNYVRAVRSLE